MDRLQRVWLELKLTWRLIRDPRVPVWTKFIPGLALVYVVSPIDLIPGFIVLLGQLDDVAVALLAMRLFQRMAPVYVVDEHRAALEQQATGDVIDAPGYTIRRDR